MYVLYVFIKMGKLNPEPQPHPPIISDCLFVFAILVRRIKLITMCHFYPNVTWSQLITHHPTFSPYPHTLQACFGLPWPPWLKVFRSASWTIMQPHPPPPPSHCDAQSLRNFGTIWFMKRPVMIGELVRFRERRLVSCGMQTLLSLVTAKSMWPLIQPWPPLLYQLFLFFKTGSIAGPGRSFPDTKRHFMHLDGTWRAKAKHRYLRIKAWQQAIDPPKKW